MAEPVRDIGVLDRSSLSREFDLASELFHRVNRIIPELQSILAFPPSRRVRDAVREMLDNGYSQAPVMENNHVLGIFSFRSFSREAARTSLEEWNKQRCAPGDLTVDEFLEPFEFARVTDEMTQVFRAMDHDNGVLIGSPERLVGILTPMDFLRYLYRVASPFVMLSEIELAVRALIRCAMSDDDISEAAKKCLAACYGDVGNVPTSLEDMTFDNYCSLVSHGDNWKHFEPVLGGTRTRTSGKLREIGTIRNDLFHFRREMLVQDHQTLADHRNWLLNKVRQADAHGFVETRQ